MIEREVRTNTGTYVGLCEDRNLLRGIEFAKRQDNTLKNTRKIAMNVHAMER